jgi:RNA polymerase sigma-70 factor (sigma-E family)
MAGNPVELEAFLAARSKALFRTAFALTGDWQRAEDLLQTALASCYGRWDRLDEPEAYVRATMVRAFLGWRRRRWVVEIVTDPIETAAGAVGHLDPGQTAVELRGALLIALAALPPRQRAVIVLRYYSDLSEAATADVLGVSVGTVKSQASKALAKLHESAGLNALMEDEER